MKKIYKTAISVLISCAMLINSSAAFAVEGTAGKKNDNREFVTMEAEQTAGYLATYIAQYEPDFGSRICTVSVKRVYRYISY